MTGIPCLNVPLFPVRISLSKSVKMSEEGIDRLEGRVDTFGGLVIRKKKTDDDNGKKPHQENRLVEDVG